MSGDDVHAPIAFCDSLLTRQAVLVATTVAVTAVIVGAVGFVVARRTLRMQIEERLAAVATDRQARVEQFGAQQHERIALVASRTRLRQLLAAHEGGTVGREQLARDASAILQDAQEGTAGFRALRVTDESGRILAAADEARVGGSVREDPVFGPARTRIHLGVPVRSQDRWEATLGAPLLDATGTFLGVVLVQVDVTGLERALADDHGLGTSGEVLVGRRAAEGGAGGIEYLFPSPRTGTREIDEAASAPMAGALRGESGRGSAHYDGVEVLGVFRPVRYQPNDATVWGLVAKMDADEAYASVRDLATWMVLLVGTLTLAGGVLAFLFARRLTRPVVALAAQARALAAGEFGARADVRSRGEIGLLADAFDRMARDLASTQEDLERRVQERTRALEQEVRDRQRAEDALREAQEELERRVQVRTEELARANAALKGEIAVRAKAETERARARALLLAAVEQSPAGILIADAPDVRIRLANPAALGIRGEASTPLLDIPAELHPQHWQTFHPDGAPFRPEDLPLSRAILEGVTLRNVDAVIRRADGEDRWVLANAAPVRNSEGEIVAGVVVFSDVTELREATEALRRAHDDLERRVAERTADLARTNAELDDARREAVRANRAKSIFLANMSHEIRTPMTAILGMTDLVLRSPLTPQQKDRLEIVKESGEALLAIIEDILDYSKIEAGKLVLDSEPFALRELVGDTLKWLATRAHEKGLDLTWEVDAQVPEIVIGDRNRLRQILVNLVGNAVKFTDEGEVAVAVTCREREAGAVRLDLEVRDTGIGIEPGKLEAIFQEFQQADGTTARRYGGTGLGLAISTRLAGLMGGHVRAESRVGAGSVFHALVRLGWREGAERAGPETTAFAGVRVLLVDGHDRTLRILTETLRAWGLEPVAAADEAGARAAVAAARAASRPFRVLLCGAPAALESGDAFASALGEAQGAPLDVVWMGTAEGRPADEAGGGTDPAAPWLLKPVKPSELLDTLLAILHPGGAPAAARPAAHGEPTAPLHILLAEDSVANQKLAVGLLEEAGHKVEVVGSGQEAVEATGTTNFDLVLMDVQMPGMDGLEATRRIRARERASGAHVPIVAMTAHALREDREECLAAGMDDYVSKPIRPEVLLGKIRRVVDAPPRPAAPPPPAPGFDRAAALRSAGGSPELLVVLADAVREEAPRLLAEIREALEGQDAEAVRRHAHTLKGALSHFGETPAVDAALRVETLGREEDLEGAAAAHCQLADEVAGFLAQLDREVPPQDGARPSGSQEATPP